MRRAICCDSTLERPCEELRGVVFQIVGQTDRECKPCRGGRPVKDQRCYDAVVCRRDRPDPDLRKTVCVRGRLPVDSYWKIVAAKPCRREGEERGCELRIRQVPSCRG